MPDDTRPDPAEHRHAGEPQARPELPLWLEELVPADVRADLAQRRRQGRALNLDAGRWAVAASEAIGRFELAADASDLSDGRRREAARRLGIGDLYAIADDLAELVEIVASRS